MDLFFVQVFENEEFGVFMEDASHVFLRPVAVYNNGFGIFASGDSYLRTLNSQVTANTTGIFFDLFSHGLLQSTDVSGNGTDTVTDRGGAFFVEP